MQSIVYFQIFANYNFYTSKLWLSPYRFFSSLMTPKKTSHSRARTLILHPSPRAIPQAMFVSKDAQVGIYIPHWCGHKEPNDQYIFYWKFQVSDTDESVVIWCHVCIYICIFMCTYMKYTKDSRSEKQDIQSLFPKSFGHVVVHDNRSWLSNTNATEDFPSRNAGVMRSKWRSCYILHRVISSF